MLIMFHIIGRHSTEREVVLITLHQYKKILLFPINLQNNMCVGLEYQIGF